MNSPAAGRIDLGNDHWMRWTTHALAPKVGIIVGHHRPDGEECEGAILFDLPGVQAAFPGRHVWRVDSWEPLTLSPSIQDKGCGDHGYIREGLWVPA